MTEIDQRQHPTRRAPHGARPLQLLRAFASGRRGAVVVIVAVAMIPLLLAAGGAIDVARFYVAKARVQYALDSALLAAGSTDPSADRAALFNQYYAANNPASSVGSTNVTAPDFSNPSTSVFNASAVLTVPTVFLKLAAIDTLETTIQAQVVRQTTGVEVALVLDSTGSMLDHAPPSSPTTKLEDLQSAASTLLDILFQGQPTSTTVKVSVVPYVSAVNIGTGNSGYVQFPTPDNEYPTNGDTSWKGCVEARDYPNDINDVYVSGDSVQGEWKPYFWEAEEYYYFNSTPSQCRNRWWRPDSPPLTIPPRPQGPTGRRPDHPPFSDVPGSFTHESGNPLPDTDPSGNGMTYGPNKSCPTPLTPLTNDRATLDAAINGLESWDDGGTIIGTGVVWGWRTLSPGEPFTEGVAYGTSGVNKVMIIMTDGENSILPPQGLCQVSNSRYTSSYSAYSYTGDLRLGTANVNLAQDETDNRLTEVCDAVKATNEITIFTITFGLPDDPAFDALKNRMRNCASDPANYFNSPSGADLQATFQAIGAKLTNLRIAQ